MIDPKKMPPDFHSMSTGEKIQYVQDLWDEISADLEHEGLTTAQVEELDRRLHAYRKDPDDTQSWEEVKALVLGAR